MSSNTQQRRALAPQYGGWREREAAKQRAREEADRLRKEAEEKARLAVTDTNFPTLSTQPTHRTSIPMFSTSFADLAEEWKVKDELTEAREQLRKERENRERILTNGVYVMSRAGSSNVPIQPLPTIVETKKKGPTIDSDGFEVVETRKGRKEKRELTEAELHRKYMEAGSESDNEDQTHNEHMFETRRHDRDYY